VKKVKHIIVSFHPCFTAEHQIILGDRKLASKDHRWIRRADAIILPQGGPRELYMACRDSGAQVFPNYNMRLRYPGKLGQTVLFEEFHLRHPATKAWSSADEMRGFVRSGGMLPHPFPFLIKADESHEGEGIFLITDPGALEFVLENLRAWEKTGQSGFITQEMVQTGGNVLRVVILGRQTIAYWKRPDDPSESVITVSRNARVDRWWRKDLQKKGRFEARRISKKTGIDLAAVDFVFSMRDPDPQPLCLEINYYFGRRGLGGSLNYYRLLHDAIKEWLRARGFDPGAVKLV
jgi:ribosomal protein S6--L-glutamate ligase